jgi:CxxC motif-containing protein
MKREMICISCPIGCHLTAEWENEETITISGNKCNRGEIYGREEILAPKRVVTATVAVDSTHMARVPVKTDTALLKEHIDPLLQKLYRLRLKAPVNCGDVLIDDVAGTGVQVVATRSIAH